MEKVKIHLLEGRTASGYTTWGCCWKRGQVRKEASFALENKNGEKIPVQSRVTAWWPDGTIKWSAHTADAKALGEEGYLIAGSEERKQEHSRGIRVEPSDEG